MFRPFCRCLALPDAAAAAAAAAASHAAGWWRRRLLNIASVPSYDVYRPTYGTEIDQLTPAASGMMPLRHYCVAEWTHISWPTLAARPLYRPLQLGRNIISEVTCRAPIAVTGHVAYSEVSLHYRPTIGSLLRTSYYNITPFALSEQSIVISMYVWASVCPSACTCSIFAKYWCSARYLLQPWLQDSNLPWWRCDALCPSGFVDDVTFALNGQEYRWRKHGAHRVQCRTGGGVWYLRLPCLIREGSMPRHWRRQGGQEAQPPQWPSKKRFFG